MSDSHGYVPPKSTIEYVHHKLLLDVNSFYGRVLYLVPHADPWNRHKMQAEWPWIVESWEAWMASGGGEFELPASAKEHLHVG
jgi:hypothetical protein